MFDVPNTITQDAVKACFAKIAPDLEFNKENLQEVLQYYSIQELLLVLVDVINESENSPVIINYKGYNIPVDKFVMDSWYKVRGYKFPDKESEVYATAYLGNILEDLDINDSVIGDAVTKGYIAERKMANGEL